MSVYSSPTNTVVGSYPKPSATLTVSNLAGLPTGAANGDAVTRQADMSLWDSTNNVFIRPEQTNVGISQ